MFQNMNPMNNYFQIQNLMNMKQELTNIELQFNSSLAQIQNMGIFSSAATQIFNISFQFINFGIGLINIGMQLSNNMFNSFDIKLSINNIIDNLTNISKKIPCNINGVINNQNFDENIQDDGFRYNVVIQSSNGVQTTIVCDKYKTVNYLIKEYLTKIGRNDLFDKDEELFFWYNAKKFNSSENKSKKLYEIFNVSTTQIIFCKILGT